MGEKTFGVDTVEGIVIRVGDEFGLLTQTLVTAAIYYVSSYNMLDNVEDKSYALESQPRNSHVIKLTTVGVGIPVAHCAIPHTPRTYC